MTFTAREWSFTSRDGVEGGVVRVALDGGVATLVLDRAASDAESRTIVELIRGPDCVEGVTSFLERRRPRFAPRVPGDER